MLHSHNNYTGREPFYEAYGLYAYSFEADIYAGEKEGVLLVAQDQHELGMARTMDEMYIKPIVNTYKRNNGRAWGNSRNGLQRLIQPSIPILCGW